MSDADGPQLKSIPGGLKQPDPGKSRPRAVSERMPTTKLPAPPTPPKAPEPQNPPQSLSTTAEFAAAHPLVKKQFGRYELLMQMGIGGMAALYLARIRGPQQFEKLLAIKKIHEHLLVEKEFVAMFRDEARIAALIHHPNVAATFDLGVIDGAYFIAMEYVHGQTLKDIVNASVRHPDTVHWSDMVRVVSEVAKGLHAAHTVKDHTGESLQVIHRDVSPQNILVSYDGHVKLVDFGIAYAAQKLSHTGAGKLKGKLGYMSPEQVAGGTVDHRSDIFSLGTVLFETLTMRRLFKEDNEARTIMKVRAARVPDLQHLCPACPPELSDIVNKALARNPDDRYPTAEAFADDIEELLVNLGKRVGRKQISGLMEKLFTERKRIKDRMRRRALASTTDTPLQGLEALDDGTASLLIDRISTSTEEGIVSGNPTSTTSVGSVTGTGTGTGATGLLVAAMAGALLVMAIVVGWLVFKPNPSHTSGEQRSHTPTSPNPNRATVMKGLTQSMTPGPRPSGQPQRPATAPSVMLTIRITPKDAKATITFRNEVQLGIIFQAALPSAKVREEITITAPGYNRRVVPIVLSQALTLPVELIPSSASAKPAAMKPDKRKRRRARRRPRPRSMLLDL